MIEEEGKIGFIGSPPKRMSSKRYSSLFYEDSIADLKDGALADF